MKRISLLLCAAAFTAASVFPSLAHADRSGDLVTCSEPNFFGLDCSNPVVRIDHGVELTFEGILAADFDGTGVTVGYTTPDALSATVLEFTDLTNPFTSYSVDAIDAINGFSASNVSLTNGVLEVSFIGTGSQDDGFVRIGLPLADGPPPTTPTAATPEPGSLMLLGTGMLGVAGAVRRRLVRK